MRWVFMMALCLMVGCGKVEPGATNMPLNKIPEPRINVAREKLPNVTFHQAWTTPKGNDELRGKNKNGKVRDIHVTLNAVVEVN